MFSRRSLLPPAFAAFFAPSASLASASLLAPAVALAGCYSVPTGRTAVDSVVLEGTSQLDDRDILEALATTPSPKFLNLWSGVLFDYSFYDRFALKADMARVERFYRARGFYQAHARVARLESTSDGHASVAIDVEEGAPVLLRSATLRGTEALPKDDADAATAASTLLLKKGAKFDEDEFTATQDAIVHTLTDRGYAYARVSRVANVDIANHVADARFDVAAGDKATLGTITIDGLANLPEAPVRRALDLKPGEPYSTAAFASAQQAVLDLGVFSSVEIRPDLPETPPANHVVNVVVKVEATALHSVQLGIGAEVDMIKTDIHAIAQWESKNLFGGMRNFTVRDKPGVVFYPTRLPDFKPPTHYLPENRLRADLRQPGFFEARTTGRIRAEYNIYPLLLGTSDDESTTLLGYHELIAAAGVERPFGRLFVNPNYNIQANFPFAFTGPKTELKSVLVSYLDLLTSVDFRDDKIHPRKGFFASFDFQLAGGVLGGDAKDIRIQPDVRAYIPLSKRWTIAARASVGFLFPEGYGDSYSRNAASGVPPASENDSWIRDLQILFFRGFYSGGSTGNRGYPLRGVGPHGAVPFFNPDVAAQQFASDCDRKSADFDTARCLYPLGGLSLWEASLEVRFPISGPLTGAGFCDASDVSPKTVSIRFDRPHLSCGLGIRYDTPVGPVRLDIGYRIPGAQFPSSISSREEVEPPRLFGFFPGAVAFGIGEAY